MKKTLKVISAILLVIMMLSFATTVLGAEVKPTQINPVYGDSSKLVTTAGKIMGMIRNIAVIASVIIIMILGVKYMLGSIEEKAEYKKSFMPLIIGIILVVAASSIATFIFNMAE